MAFNPFTWFRKHQKVFFAILTVICMFVFIGQVGVGADIFQTALKWFGAGKSNGETLITLYGKKVSENDLNALSRHRRLASNFLLVNAAEYHPKAIRSLDKNIAPTAPGNPLSGLKEIVSSMQMRAFFLNPAFHRNNPQGLIEQVVKAHKDIEQNLNGGPEGKIGLIHIYLRLRDEAKREQEKDPEKTIDPDRLQMLINLATILNYQDWVASINHLQALAYYYQMRPVFEDFPLGGLPKPDDLLDFMVWQRKADDLGITLTDADVIREINMEAGGQTVIDPDTKSLAKEKAITDFLKRESPNAPPSELINALREEFRVALVQGLLLGSEPGVRSFRSQLGGTGSPAVGTPDEFLKYYREQRTEVNVKLLPIPVRQFLDKVKATPSDQDLYQFYERFKEKEPSPTSRDPGFKEPRRIVAQYVVGNPDDSFYRSLAAKDAAVWHSYDDPAAQVARCIGSVATTPFGAPVLARAALILTALRLNPEQEEYDKVVFTDNQPWVTKDPTKDFESPDAWRSHPRIHTAYLLNKYNLISSFGVLSGSAAGVGAPYAGPLGLVLACAWDETRGSLRQNLVWMLARANTSPSGTAYPQSPITQAALTIPFSPHVPSRKEMEPLLRGSLQSQIALDKLRGNLRTLLEELRKLKTKDRAAHDAYLAKAVKEYHLTLHTMPKPMSREVLLDALNHHQAAALDLADLMEVYLDREVKPPVQDFVGELFAGSGTYEAQELQTTQFQRREFVYWRAEDHPPRIRPFRAIRAQVEEAWRLAQARKLARKEVERLEETINNHKMSARKAEEFLQSQHPGKLFELDHVAQLVPPPREVHPGIETTYQPYRLPSDKADLMKDPPDDLVKHLLDLKQPGQATYVVDKPATTFYLAILMSRKEPTVKQFLDRYQKSLNLDPLYNQFLQTQQREFHKAVMEQLRREATGGKLDKDGRYDLPDSIRKREGRLDEE